jgi:hypothetical protein
MYVYVFGIRESIPFSTENETTSHLYCTYFARDEASFLPCSVCESSKSQEDEDRMVRQAENRARRELQLPRDESWLHQSLAGNPGEVASLFHTNSRLMLMLPATSSLFALPSTANTTIDLRALISDQRGTIFSHLSFSRGARGTAEVYGRM